MYPCTSEIKYAPGLCHWLSHFRCTATKDWANRTINHTVNAGGRVRKPCSVAVEFNVGEQAIATDSKRLSVLLILIHLSIRILILVTRVREVFFEFLI